MIEQVLDLTMKNILIVILAFVISSCGKHAEKVAGTYSGALTINDTLSIEGYQILIDEIDKDEISIVCDSFSNYNVNIDKQRYFSSVSYYSTNQQEQLEVYDDGLLILVHTDPNGKTYNFVGNRD